MNSKASATATATDTGVTKCMVYGLLPLRKLLLRWLTREQLKVICIYPSTRESLKKLYKIIFSFRFIRETIKAPLAHQFPKMICIIIVIEARLKLLPAWLVLPLCCG